MTNDINPAKRSTYDWILEILSLSGLLSVFYPLFFYNTLSEDIQIPIHYNALGEIDGWGNRNFLWILAIITLVFYLIISVCERHYKKINYPVKIKEDNANSLYRLGVRLLRHTKAIGVVLFAFLNNTSYFIAIGKVSGSTIFAPLICLIVLLLIVVLSFYLKMCLFKARD